MHRSARSLGALLVIAGVACSSFGSSSDDGVGGGEPTDGGVGEANEAASDADAGVIDTSNDPSNCGAVGHDCVGGACVSGICQPVVLFSGVDAQPAGMNAGRVIEPSIAVDATRVLWLLNGGNDGRIAGCPKSGCAGTTPSFVAPVTNGTMGSIASDGTEAFVAVIFGGFGIFRVEKDGVAPITNTLDFMADLRVADERLYFTQRRSNDQGGGIWTVKRDGTDQRRLAPKPTVDAGSGDDDLLRVAVGSDAVFAASPSIVWGKGLADVNASTPPSFVVDVLSDTPGIVADRAKNQLYWVDRGQRTIHRCATSGVTCTNASTISQDTLTSRNAMPTALAYDGVRLYVTADVAGEAGVGSALYVCAAEDCKTTWSTIATAPLIYGAAAFDGTAVYWMELVTDGDPKTYRIMKIAK